MPRDRRLSARCSTRGGQERVIKDMDGHSADSKVFRRYYTIERSTKEAAVKAQE